LTLSPNGLLVNRALSLAILPKTHRSVTSFLELLRMINRGKFGALIRDGIRSASSLQPIFADRRYNLHLRLEKDQAVANLKGVIPTQFNQYLTNAAGWRAPGGAGATKEEVF